MSKQEELQAALAVMQQFGEWIRNADTKAGLMSAVLSILVVGLSQNPGAIRFATSSQGGRGHLALGLLALMIISGALAGLNLLRLQIPRLPATDRRNHFAFPSVARSKVEDLQNPSAHEVVQEAWEQAHELAGIAFKRFTVVRIAWIWTGIALAGFLPFAYISSTGTS
jgi:hypothetical protein